MRTDGRQAFERRPSACDARSSSDLGDGIADHDAIAERIAEQYDVSVPDARRDAEVFALDLCRQLSAQR